MIKDSLNVTPCSCFSSYFSGVGISWLPQTGSAQNYDYPVNIFYRLSTRSSIVVTTPRSPTRPPLLPTDRSSTVTWFCHVTRDISCAMSRIAIYDPISLLDYCSVASPMSKQRFNSDKSNSNINDNNPFFADKRDSGISRGRIINQHGLHSVCRRLRCVKMKFEYLQK